MVCSFNSKRNPNKWKQLLFIFGLFIYSDLALAYESGSCDKFDFSEYSLPDGGFGYASPIRVLSNNVAITDDDGVIIEHLSFGRVLRPVDEKAQKVKVEVKIKDVKHTGWVDKKEILCGFLPLKNNKGVERKAFVKGQVVSLGAKNLSWVKPDLNMDVNDCTPATCQQLTRFDRNFIYEQRGEQVLLSKEYRLDDYSKQLLGWISLDNIFLWDSIYALRPTVNPDENRPLCIFSTLEQAKDFSAGDVELLKKCKSVAGGEGWFETDARIPLLDVVDGKQVYKVAFPAYRVLAEQKGDSLVIPGQSLAGASLSSKSLGGLDLSRLMSLKNKDIFFVIDGTRSMTEAINAIRGTEEKAGVVQRVVDEIISEPYFSESKFRFGFRVYRDGFYKGVNEGLSLSNMECAPDEEEQSANRAKFNQELAKVAVTSNDNDDYPEDVYGGLLGVLSKDIRGCEDNLKIIILIGDHGDREGNPQNLLPYLIDKNDKKATKMLVLIQSATNQNNYGDKLAQDAYKEYTTQAASLLAVAKQEQRYFHKLDEALLVERIIEDIKLTSHPFPDEIAFDIRNGKAFTASVEALKAKYAKIGVNIPQVIWDISDRKGKGLGEQYDKTVYDHTMIGYIPVDPESFVEEVWLTNDEFENWRGVIRKIAASVSSTGHKKREEVFNGLIAEIQRLIGNPPYSQKDETLDQYIRRGQGLPNSENSPLMSYGEDLRDPNLIEDCEIDNLRNWIRRSNRMLDMVANNQLPKYTITEPLTDYCELSDKGKKVPYILADPKAEVLCKNNRKCSYSHSLNGTSIYWIPEEYLP